MPRGVPRHGPTWYSRIQAMIPLLPPNETRIQFLRRKLRNNHRVAAGCQEGNYHVRCVLYIVFLDGNPNIIKSELFNEIIVIRGFNTIIPQLAAHIGKVLRERFRDNGSNPTLVHIDNLQVESRNSGHTTRMVNIPLHLENSKYLMLGDLDPEYYKNVGECVPDYLMHELLTHNPNTRINRSSFLSAFGVDYQTKGVSSQQVIDWSTGKDIQIIILGPDHKCIASHTPPTPPSSKTLKLVFIANNEHLYPVNGDLKRQVLLHKELKFEPIKFDIKFDKYDRFIDTPENYERLERGEYPTQNRIILMDTEHINELAQYINSRYMITRIRFDNKSNIKEFEHPKTGQIIVASEDFEIIQSLCKEMKSRINSDNFEFRNQTYTQLMNNWYKNKYGIIPISNYSTDYIDLLTNHPLNSYIRSCGAKVVENQGNVYAIDTNRCYASILINNQTPWCAYSKFNIIEPFDRTKPIIAGEFYINRKIVLSHSTLEFSADMYNANVVNDWLEKGYITIDDITLQKLPSRIIPADSFKASTLEQLNDPAFKDSSKRMINNFVGSLGTLYNKTITGCTTTSRDTADAYQLENPNCQISYLGESDTSGGSYFIRNTVKELQYSGHMAIHRQIICASYINLDNISIAINKQNPDAVRLGYHTDCIKVQSKIPLKFLPKSKCSPGDYGFEKFSGTIIGNNTYPIHKPLTGYTTPTPLIPCNEIPNDKGCLIGGGGGYGKSWLLRKSKNDNDIVLSFTNAAINLLTDMGVTNAYTFDRFFNEHHRESDWIQKLSKHSKIYVDELYMCPSKFLNILSCVKKLYPSIQMYLFGDSYQTRHLETIIHDYRNSKLIHELVDGNVLDLTYRPESSRYDDELNRDLEQFKKTQIMPLCWRDKICSQSHVPYRNNICFHLAVRARVNKQCFEYFSKDKETIEIAQKKYHVGMSIIAYAKLGSKHIANSDRLWIKEIDSTKQTLIVGRNEKLVPEPFIELNAHDLDVGKFEMGYCATVIKFEGATIDDHICIHDSNIMTHNQLYTAVSRTTRFEYLHFAYKTKHDRIFEFETPTPPLHITKIKPLTTITGYIYKIFAGDSTDFYIGSTFKELQIRLKEHKECGGVNKLMADWIYNNDPELSGKIQIKLLEQIDIVNDRKKGRFLENIENAWISNMKPTLNIKNLDNPIPKTDHTKTIPNTRKETKRFKINDQPNSRYYIIRWTENDKKINKKIYYVKIDKPTALIKAEQFRTALIKRLL